MVTVRIPNYCHNCPNFEVKQLLPLCTVNFSNYKEYDTIVTCKKMDNCKELHEYLQRGVSDD